MEMVEERAPYSKPLTGAERRELIAAIDGVSRQRGVHGKNSMKNRLDFEKEVEEAMREHRLAEERRAQSLARAEEKKAERLAHAEATRTRRLARAARNNRAYRARLREAVA